VRVLFDYKCNVKQKQKARKTVEIFIYVKKKSVQTSEKCASYEGLQLRNKRRLRDQKQKKTSRKAKGFTQRWTERIRWQKKREYCSWKKSQEYFRAAKVDDKPQRKTITENWKNHSQFIKILLLPLSSNTLGSYFHIVFGDFGKKCFKPCSSSCNPQHMSQWQYVVRKEHVDGKEQSHECSREARDGACFLTDWWH
jgi:hypothetical protein